jgi:hypothetical protein
MTVTYYTSADGSAPTLNDTAGALGAVLDAILVAGYGSKSGAGWTRTLSGSSTHQWIWTQGSGNSCILQLDDSAATGTATYARAIGGKSSTGTFGIANITDPFPTTSQLSGGVYWPRFPYSPATSPSRWACIATSKTFYFWNEGDGTNNGSTGYQQVFWFGDIDSFVGSDAYGTSIMGNTSAAQRTVVYTAMGSNTVGLYLAGDYAQTPNATTPSPAGIISDYYKNGAQANMGGTSAANAIFYPNPEDGAAYLSYIYVQESVTGGNSIRGFLPGIWNPDFFVGTTLATPIWASFTSLPGMSADALNGKTFHYFILSNAGTIEGGIVFETSNTWS